MITFGIMAAVNAAIIIFDNSKLKSNKERKDIIQHEAQRFAFSHALKSEYELATTENTNNNNTKTIDVTRENVSSSLKTTTTTSNTSPVIIIKINVSNKENFKLYMQN